MADTEAQRVPVATFRTSTGPIDMMISWRKQIATLFGIFIFICGIVSMKDVRPACIGGGILQLFIAIFILIMEIPLYMSSIIPCCECFLPVSNVFEGNLPLKTVTYIGLTILSVVTGCLGVMYFLGFFSALFITIIYCMALIGLRGQNRIVMQDGREVY